MQKSLLAVLAFSLLSGCGTAMTPLTGQAVTRSALAAQAHAVDADKHAIAPPAPLPPRQAFSRNDVYSIATAAYAQAYHASKPAEAVEDATLALEKIRTMVPSSALALQVVPYAEMMLKTEVSDGENQRRLALWPLLYISKGLETDQDPTFFELTQKMMETMGNWKDGMAVGLQTLDFLNSSDNAYFKSMADKAMSAYRDPKNDMQESYQATLATFKAMGTKLAALKH